VIDLAAAGVEASKPLSQRLDVGWEARLDQSLFDLLAQPPAGLAGIDAPEVLAARTEQIDGA